MIERDHEPHDDAAPDKTIQTVEHENEAPSVRDSLVEAVDAAEDKEIETLETTCKDIKPTEELDKELPAYAQKMRNLSPDAKRAIIQREKEIYDGWSKHQISEKGAAFDQLAEVIQPYLPAIQRFGATVPQTIDRLFAWMHHLSHSDKNIQLRAFHDLARSFNIDLTDNSELSEQQHQNVMQGLSQREQQRLQHQQQQQQHAQQQVEAHAASVASKTIEEFKKTHPHYERLRMKMHGLISGGLAQGLQDSYDMAMRLDKSLSLGSSSRTNGKTAPRSNSKAAPAVSSPSVRDALRDAIRKAG
jgi:hypothetical protein